MADSTSDIIERLKAKFRRSSEADRAYERPMSWDDAEQLVAEIERLRKALESPLSLDTQDTLFQLRETAGSATPNRELILWCANTLESTVKYAAWLQRELTALRSATKETAQAVAEVAPSREAALVAALEEAEETIRLLVSAQDVWTDYGSGFRIHFSFAPGSDMSVVTRVMSARSALSATKETGQ